ncbi:nucleotidyltransferase family protein [Stutzerimonas azotifigens]|uniref:nucleotidyltransferase family protein n=1 Tax=Stutzerimonas azotifigens TaxID=291995 RepID=UPI00280B9559|nr:nucleotidyltransferase family protein [Stutzerimonas azotifigens]
MALSASGLIDAALTNPINVTLLERLPSLSLPQCVLTAGCLYQAWWNRQAGLPPHWGVKDYDLFYFDHDLSWEAEDRVIRQVAALTADLGVTVEVKNQARVHLWYPQRFGLAYPQLNSSREGVDRYLVACTCVAIDVVSGELYAPFGLNELDHGLLRCNPLTPQPELFAGKAESYRARWPWLTLID